MIEKEIQKVNVAAGVVIERDGKYLLVQEKQKRAYGLWNLPAGKVEVGDSIEQTAIKEAKEETGYNVEIIKEVGVYHEAADAPVKHAFEAKIIGGELKIPEDEILDAKWFSLEEMIAQKDKMRKPWVIQSIQDLKS